VYRVEKSRPLFSAFIDYMSNMLKVSALTSDLCVREISFAFRRFEAATVRPN